MTLREMLPGKGEHALFVGQTGCGKTTLARYLCDYHRYVVIYDISQGVDWPGYAVVTRLKDLPQTAREIRETPRIIYQPERSEWRDPAALAGYWEWVYERQNCVAYVDEVYAMAEVAVTEQYLACLTRGRKRRISVWNSTQRPAWVPLQTLSEAKHRYIFQLPLDRDRARIEDVTGVSKGTINLLPEFQYYYSRQGASVRGPYVLRIGGK